MGQESSKMVFATHTHQLVQRDDNQYIWKQLKPIPSETEVDVQINPDQVQPGMLIEKRGYVWLCKNKLQFQYGKPVAFYSVYASRDIIIYYLTKEVVTCYRIEKTDTIHGFGPHYYYVFDLYKCKKPQDLFTKLSESIVDDYQNSKERQGCNIGYYTTPLYDFKDDNQYKQIYLFGDSFLVKKESLTCCIDGIFKIGTRDLIHFPKIQK